MASVSSIRPTEIARPVAPPLQVSRSTAEEPARKPAVPRPIGISTTALPGSGTTPSPSTESLNAATRRSVATAKAAAPDPEGRLAQEQAGRAALQAAGAYAQYGHSTANPASAKPAFQVSA